VPHRLAVFHVRPCLQWLSDGVLIERRLVFDVFSSANDVAPATDPSFTWRVRDGCSRRRLAAGVIQMVGL